jgi:hypothetical protein
MPLTCGHNVAAGAWCHYCGATIDDDVVRAFARAALHDEFIEMSGLLQLENAQSATVGACAECGAAVLVSTAGWTRCDCGSATTLIQ